MEDLDFYEVKTCPKCREAKPKKDFSPRKNSKRGIASWCKKCTCKYILEYAKKNPEYDAKRKIASKKACDKYREKYAKKNAVRLKNKYKTDPEFRKKVLDSINQKNKVKREKENVLKKFKWKPKAIDGYNLIKNSDGLWEFIKASV